MKVKQIPALALRVGGVFVPMIRELNEILYQFTGEFVIDAEDTTDTFGLTATPLDAQVRATVAATRAAALVT